MTKAQTYSACAFLEHTVQESKRANPEQYILYEKKDKSLDLCLCANDCLHFNFYQLVRTIQFLDAQPGTARTTFFKEL